MKTTIYNAKTGEPVEVEGVDAREYIASGGWVSTKPKPKKATVKPAPKTEKKAE